ncbi:MAG: putative transport system permease protein [Bacillota bacterium]|nr:putative transport system permease protein [Bacillota bacterium]MDK2784731.1 putative transport system permease protein [Bacillota bacterium]MDK2882788.1 putative transport system permease protein [Bacillota bacterium]
MTFLLSLKLAWRGILANKLRSFLAMLGVIIGVASVIALVSVGQGARLSIQRHLESLGSNVIEVHSQGWDVRFTPELIEDLKTRVAGVKYVMPVIGLGGNLKWRNNFIDTPAQGVTQDFLEIREFKLAGGRNLSEVDVRERRRVLVIGAAVAEQLFRGVNPVGEEVYFNNQRFTVVGVLAAKMPDQEYGIDRTIYLPYTTAQRLMGGAGRIDTINIKAAGAKEASQAALQLRRIFFKMYRRPDAAYVMSRDDMLKQVAEMNRTMTLMLAAIAGISLLVGGIGIMNIMLVSVTERTREIGIRKAVGAQNIQILSQFLIEAAIISGAGGIIGILVGSGASLLIRRFGPPTALSLFSILVAFGFALLVGAASGVWPAAKAAALEPTDALR